MERTSPKDMANRIARLLKEQHPDSNYLKKVFQYVREDLSIRGGAVRAAKLPPDLLTEGELRGLYAAVWNSSNQTHVIMLKLLLFTGLRNVELVNLKLGDVDLLQKRIRIGRSGKDEDRLVPFPAQFTCELAWYMSVQEKKGAVYLFESKRMSKFTTRSIRLIVENYAKKAGIAKRVHPRLFRHQILAYLASKGIVDTKIQLLSGRKTRYSLGVYRHPSLVDLENEYRDAMKDFPIQ